MSSAKKDKQEAASCLHVSSFLLIFFYRAKPEERDGAQRNRAALRSYGRQHSNPPLQRCRPSGVEPSPTPFKRKDKVSQYQEPTMIKSVIFDMDGVLIDSEICYLQYDLAFARSKNPNVTIDQLYGMVGASKEPAWRIMAQAIDNGQTWQELRREYRASIDVFSQVDYRAIFRPEAVPVLESLKSHNYSIALASSTQMDIIQRVLSENQITHYFQVIVTGDQFKQSKPHPEIYHYTASRLGTPENQCLVIEDSTLGITAASRAGMTIAALIDDRFGFDRSLAHYEIASLTEIPGILGIASPVISHKEPIS